MIIEGTEKILQRERMDSTTHVDLRTGLRLIDYITFIYLGVVAGLLVFFHRGVEFWPWLVLGHVAVGLLILGLIRAASTGASKTLIFIRDTYPFFLFMFMFKEVSLIINIFFPFWLEASLIKWDLFLFGNHPTVWLQKFSSPWFSELMAFSYWSYYFYFPLVGILLYIRKDRRLYHSYAFNLAFTMYTCYLLFLFLGARGPHETLGHLHIQRDLGWVFDRMVHSIQNSAKISGAAFPSSHVAAMWVAWFYMFKFRKSLGWAFTPLILSLSFSVVYMQYHYAVDALAGVAMALITFSIGSKLEKIFDRPARVEASRYVKSL